MTDVTYMKNDHGRKLAYASAATDSVIGLITVMNLSMFNEMGLVIETLRFQLSPEDARKDLDIILLFDQIVLYLTEQYQILEKELGYSQSVSKCETDNVPM